MVCLQIALGGWTSTNYAALSCPDFPLCQNQIWPKMSWQAFNLIGASYLENPLHYMSLEARTGIHMAHRIGAFFTSFLIIILCWALRDKKIIMPVLGLLILQISLGITNVLALLPLSVALAHNGIATLLLLVFNSFTILYQMPWQDYLELCKPKVVLLMMLTAWVGMLLASPPAILPLNALILGSLGIALTAGSATIINHMQQTNRLSYETHSKSAYRSRPDFS